MFATDIHFHPSLIFEGMARSLPLEWRPLEGLRDSSEGMKVEKKSQFEWEHQMRLEPDLSYAQIIFSTSKADQGVVNYNTTVLLHNYVWLCLQN